MDGILCIDKPAEITSFVCCAKARRILGEKKAGHAGTLDPMATGVLPILIGKATRALDLIPTHDKRYTATMQFGFESDTLDIWGNVRKTEKKPPVLSEIEAVLPRFRGDILQVPPMTSALKKDGKRLYELARQGIEVERQPRPVTVYTLEILDYQPESGTLTFDCHCSKGTYIRSICDDIGRLLGCGAVMTALRRTMAAGFSLSDCVTFEALEAAAEKEPFILPIEKVFSNYPAVTVSAAQAVRFRNGGALAAERLHTKLPQTPVRVFAPDGVFLGLGQEKEQSLAVLKLFV